MKRVVFVLVFATISSTLFSQSGENVNEKRIKYGFNVGLNYSNLIEAKALSENASIENGIGVRLGILADFKWTNSVSVSPKAELSFNNSQVNFVNTDGSNETYEVMPVSLEFMTHFVFRKNRDGVNPYFLVGPNIRVPISIDTNETSSYNTGTDVAIDLGIGFEKSFTFFNLAPELRYSWGLLDVNKNPAIQELNYHTVTLVINLLG